MSLGTHPIPLKYLDIHARLPFWKSLKMGDLAGDLMAEDRQIMEAYN